MSPGLDHFIDDKDDSTENKTKEEDDNKDKSEPISIDYDWSDRPGKVDHDAEKNICPHCMTVGGQHEYLGWKCPNDDCGTIAFGRGWHQWMQMGWDQDIEFLDSIDWVKVIEMLNARE